MQCEYCGREFEKWPFKKVVRGKKHVFCSGTCHNLWFYKVPKFDIDMMYSQVTSSVPADLVDRVLEEEV